ncbi:MAG: fatty acyl-AMP ligase [Chloroflexota bacterium]
MVTSGSVPTLTYSTLVDVLETRLQETPDQVAYTFLRSGNNTPDRITYRQLAHQVHALSVVLHHHQSVGQRVLLLLPSGLPYIIAYLSCLSIGAVAVPAYPPHSVRSLPRIQSIVADSQASIVLTTEHVWHKIQQWREHIPDLTDLTWLTVDTFDETLSTELVKPVIERTTLAFLQYTSGSTSLPKGVMVSHENLLHNLSMMYTHWKLDMQEHPVGVSWLPIFHDMGLIAGMLLPLYGGFPAFFMAPTDFIHRPLCWLQALSEYRGTYSCAPNFAYELCVRRVNDADIATLDLQHWRVALNGAEPIQARTLERFTEKFAVCGFQPQHFLAGYGLAEATLMVSCGNPVTSPSVKTVSRDHLTQHVVKEVAENDHRPVQELISCGPPSGEQKVLIVHPETCEPCSSHEVGEIWVAGPSVAQGYWQNPTETTETFQAYVANGEGPFLRTGDLGVLLEDELYLMGRLKDLIIIGGRNYYPQDIEMTVEQSHDAIRLGGCASFSVTTEYQERLVILAEVSHRYKPIQRHQTSPQVPSHYIKVPEQELIQTIRRAIVDTYDVPIWKVVLLKAGSVCKTSSGKIQRRACQAAFLAGNLKLWDS